MEHPTNESIELMYDEEEDEIYEEEIILDDDDDTEVLEEYEIEYIDEEVVEDSEYEVVEYVTELEDEALVEPQDDEVEPEEPTTTAHTIQAVEVQVKEYLKEDEVLVIDAPEQNQSKEESAQETPDVEEVQINEDDISTKNDENDAISDENTKPAASEAQLKNDAVIADSANSAVDEKIDAAEAQIASAPSDGDVPELEAQDVNSEQLNEVEQQDSKIEEAEDSPVEEDPQVKEAAIPPAPAEPVVKETETPKSNVEPSGKRNGSDAEKTPKAHNKSIGQAPNSPNKHREQQEKTIGWEKPDWVKNSPLKSPKKKVDALLMSPGKQIGWEKPNWVEAKLKSTGADVKKGVDLQAPITHVEKDEKNIINLEANPLYLKPTEKGTAVRLGENLARPITFINGKDPSVK